jgi:hypothetical protein
MDLEDKETEELNILKEYLPEQLSEPALNSLVGDIIKEVGATGKGDIGKVMKAIMAKVQGRADGKLVSRIAGEQLAKLKPEQK